MLGVADSGKAKEVGKVFRYDNSKPMGNAVANESSHLLNKDGLMIHTAYDQERQESNLIDLWENICEQIQNHLDKEDDDRVFRLLLPNFDQFMAAEATQKDITAMVRFLRNLKTLVRATNCVCLISVEESLLKPHLTSNLRFLAD